MVDFQRQRLLSDFVSSGSGDSELSSLFGVHQVVYSQRVIVLERLSRLEPLSEIRAFTGLSSQALHQLLLRLARKRWVERQSFGVWEVTQEGLNHLTEINGKPQFNGFEPLVEGLSEHKLEDLGRLVRETYKRRHKSKGGSKHRKYGNMNKGFTENEAEAFFSVVDNPRHRLLFEFQAFLGLRIGEAVRVKVEDLNLSESWLRVATEKSGKTDFVPLPPFFVERVKAYLECFGGSVAQHAGYLFYSTHRVGKPISAFCARNLFNRYRARAGLVDTYGVSDDLKPRKLYRISTHSFRHAFLTRAARELKDVSLVSKLARHSNLSATEAYIHRDFTELREAINQLYPNFLMTKARGLK